MVGDWILTKKFYQRKRRTGIMSYKKWYIVLNNKIRKKGLISSQQEEAIFYFN